MNSDNISYLRIIGRLHPNNKLELRPSYLIANPRRTKEDPDGLVHARLYDSDGKLLLKYNLTTKHYFNTHSNISSLAVRGEIPFPSETRTIRFYRDDVEIYELPVPKEKPTVRLTWEVPDNVKGKQIITWEGKHPIKAQPVQFFLRYTSDNAKTWQRVGFRTRDKKHEIDFDQLPGGKSCIIAVVATDGVNTVIDKSKAFNVQVKPCQVFILEPEDGTEFFAGQTIILRGQGYYLEERAAEKKDLVWHSSINKKLGVGRLLEISDLDVGVHEIRLVGGKGKRSGEAKVTVQVKKR